MEKCNLMVQEVFFEVTCLARDNVSSFLWDYLIVSTMQVKAADLAPVYPAIGTTFPVKHIGVHAADTRAVIVYPAPTFLKEPAGHPGVILTPYGKTRCIEDAVLVRHLEERGWLQG